jgi:hypothetical protein
VKPKKAEEQKASELLNLSSLLHDSIDDVLEIVERIAKTVACGGRL